MTLKVDGWPRKTIGHLFYTTSSFVRHFKSIGEFKLELQFENSRFGSKLIFFFVPCDLAIWWMTLKNNSVPLQYYVKICASFHKPWVNLNWSYSPDTLNSGQNRRFFVLCDLEIWQMTLKNNRATLLYYVKLCASVQSHRWIQFGVTVRKLSIRVKIGDFFFVPCDLEIWCMTLKNNRAPLLCYFKLSASFRSHSS